MSAMVMISLAGPYGLNKTTGGGSRQATGKLDFVPGDWRLTQSHTVRDICVLYHLRKLLETDLPVPV